MPDDPSHIFELLNEKEVVENLFDMLPGVPLQVPSRNRFGLMIRKTGFYLALLLFCPDPRVLSLKSSMSQFSKSKVWNKIK